MPRILTASPRVRGRRLPPLPIAALIVAAVVANFWYLGWALVEPATAPRAFDWNTLVESGRRVHEGGLYDHDPYYLYVWSPVAAWLFTFIGPIGMFVWSLLHVAVVLLVPDRRVQLMVLLSWPFWIDLIAGNIVTFVLVSALWALRGNNPATVVYFILALLAPRPLQLPVLAWLLVTRPRWRLPFLALAVVHLALVAVSGWGPEWVATLIANSRELENPMNVGPSQLIGAVWIPIGLALGIWLTVRGRLGWASLAVSPYWLPMYLLMAFLELDDRRAWVSTGPRRRGQLPTR